MADEDIDTSDIPPLDEEFFAKAKLRVPNSKTPIATAIREMTQNSSSLLFDVDDSSNHNVTINWRDDPLNEFDIYAGRYQAAANKLAEELLSHPNFHDIDPCPIVFLYRHAIELYLKAICLKGYKFFQVLGKNLSFNGHGLTEERLFKNHHLPQLLETVKQVTEEMNEDWEFENSDPFENYQDFRAAIEEFEKLDSWSSTFRYPYSNREKTASLQKGFTFDFASFKEKIEFVISVLDGISTQLRIDLDNALEFAYDQQQVEANSNPDFQDATDA
ncbi:MAG: hypothetical protein HC812_08780 [Leptolyngbya sp. RL_3_1]|nr:hypothetical protein [Leptolyngbya sp. RL_3_1]